MDRASDPASKNRAPSNIAASLHMCVHCDIVSMTYFVATGCGTYTLLHAQAKPYSLWTSAMGVDPLSSSLPSPLLLSLANPIFSIDQRDGLALSSSLAVDPVFKLGKRKGRRRTGGE